MIRPRSEFDRKFLRHVLPRMLAAINLGATLVRYDLESFTEATSRVWRVGCKRGATHLSELTFDELLNWVDSQLLEALDRPPAPGLVTPGRLASLTGEPRLTRQSIPL